MHPAYIEKSAATRQLKIMRKLFTAGNDAGVEALAERLAARGMLKETPLGSQLGHLGRGVEGLATATVGATGRRVPSHVLSARKIIDPKGIGGFANSNPVIMAERMAVLRRAAQEAARAGEPNPFAALQSKRLGRTPGGTRYLHSEFVRDAANTPRDRGRKFSDLSDDNVMGRSIEDTHAGNLHQRANTRIGWDPAAIVDFVPKNRNPFSDAPRTVHEAEAEMYRRLFAKLEALRKERYIKERGNPGEGFFWGEPNRGLDIKLAASEWRDSGMSTSPSMLQTRARWFEPVALRKADTAAILRSMRPSGWSNNRGKQVRVGEVT